MANRKRPSMLDDISNVFDRLATQSPGKKKYLAIHDGKLTLDDTGKLDHSIDKVVPLVQEALPKQPQETDLLRLHTIEKGLKSLHEGNKENEGLQKTLKTVSFQIVSLEHQKLVKGLINQQDEDTQKFLKNYFKEVANYQELARSKDIFENALRKLFIDNVLPRLLDQQQDKVMIKFLQSKGIAVVDGPVPENALPKQPTLYCSSGSTDWGKAFEDFSEHYPKNEAFAEAAFSILMRFKERFQFLEKPRLEMMKDLSVDTILEILKRQEDAFSHMLEVHQKMSAIASEKRAPVRDKMLSATLPTLHEKASYDDLYLEDGICFGGCLVYAAEKIAKKKTDILPNAKARFFEAAHVLRKESTVGKTAEPVLWSQILEKRNALSGKNISQQELCKELCDILLLIAKFQNNPNMYADTEKLKASFITAPEKDVAQRLVKVVDAHIGAESKQAIKGIDTTFLKKLGIELRQRLFGQSSDRQIETNAFVHDLEKLIDAFKIQGEGHFLVDLIKREKVKTTDKIPPLPTSKLATKIYTKLQELSNLDMQAFQQLPLEKKKEHIAKLPQNTLILETVQDRIGDKATKEVIERVSYRVQEEVDEILSILTHTPNQTAKKEESHIIYCKLTPPYELQDVNFPGPPLFQTNDLTEFKLYLSFYFLLNNYTHVNQMLEVTPRKKP